MAHRTTTGIAGVLLAVVLTPACVGVGVQSLEQFEAAIERGASCAELFDQRTGFDDERDLAHVDDLLQRIGCVDRNAERNDQ